MNMVAKILFEARSKTVKRATDLKESAEMHRHIYRAIRERKPEAARQAMREHLLLAQKAQLQEVQNNDSSRTNGGNGSSGGKPPKEKSPRLKK
jgi:GntR family transcriptional repressor for pyruvate dehydrogenase complex